MKKRFLSIAMVLCLTLSLLPTAAFAEEGETSEPDGGSAAAGEETAVLLTGEDDGGDEQDGTSENAPEDSVPETETDRDTTGYKGEELPQGPDMSGTVVKVTPENAQYTLDGAYGSINGKTIHFTGGPYEEVLVLARSTKFSGSNTLYYNMTWASETGWVTDSVPTKYDEFISKPSGTTTYSRTVSGVTFTADENVVLPGFASSSGHVYDNGYDYVLDKVAVGEQGTYYCGSSLENITFQGLTIQNSIALNNYVGKTEATNSGITIEGCTFLGDVSQMSTNGYTAINFKADSEYYNDITVSDCTFTNYFQGIYIQGVDGLSVENCSISNTGHNAIAVQSSVSNPVQGTVTISGTTIQDTGDRAIRFGDIGEDVSAVIENNTFIDATDLDGELMKTGTTGDGFSLALENNQWTQDGAVKTETELFAAMGVSAVAEVGGAIYSTLSGAVDQAAPGETVTLLAPAEISEVIEIERDLTLDLNGYQITNHVAGDRPFHITKEVDFTVDGTEEGSGMTIPETNTGAYGFIKVAAPSTVTLNGGTYSGSTDNGAFVKVFRNDTIDASGSTVIYDDVTMTSNSRFFDTDTLLTDASIPTLQVTGGTYTTDGKAFGTDTIYASPVTFEGVTVTAGTGPCIEVCGPAATFTNCTFTVTGENSNDFGTTAVAVSFDGSATINSGIYSAQNGYGAYVYSSGGTINIMGGTVSGGDAAVRADVDSSTYDNPATVNISGGTIKGTLQTNGNDKATISVSGGTFDQTVPEEFCAPGMKPSGNADSGFTVTTDTSIFASGNGTETTPFIIDSVEKLAAFRDSVNEGETYRGQYIQLAAGSYALSSNSWTPIGNGTRSGSGYTGNSFQGHFNGNGQTITGLKNTSISDANAAVGLFGVVDGGTVKKLTLSEVNINVSDNECAGGAIGLLTGGTADWITVSGTVSAARGNGGIVGRMTISGTISNCTNHATISGTGGANVGGIVGAAYYTGDYDGGVSPMYITNCTNDGTVTGTAGAVGGIVGLSSAHVSGCTNTAAITGNGADVAGIVAEQQNYGSIAGCTNSGIITNNSTDYGTGGIVGWVRYSGADASYPTKAIIEIRNNTNSGKIDGGNDGGGIVGTVYNAAVVTGNENTAVSISGTTFAAGIVGNIQNDTGAYQDNPDVDIYNNVSTTPIEQIVANCDDEYAYNNFEGNSAYSVRENSTAWVAKIGEQRYATLQVAIDATKSNDEATVITVIRDVTLEEPLDLSGTQGLTLKGATSDVTISAGTGISDQQILSGGTVNGLTLQDLTFTNAIIRLTTSGAVVVENCTFQNTTSSQGDKSGVLNVLGSGSSGASLTVTGSTFQNLKLADEATGEEFVGIYTQGSMDAITVQNSTFQNIAGTALSLRNCDNITITGNTFEDWANGSKNNAGRAVRVDFGSRTGAQSLTFTKNKLVAGTNVKESYVKIGEIAGSNTDVTLNVGKNYWDGKDPVTGTVNSTGMPVLEIVIGNDTLDSDDLQTNSSITGENTYYIRDTMRPEDLNTYVPPVNPDGGNSGGSSDSEPSYSPVIDITGGGDVKVSPRTPSEGDEVTITPDPDNGYEVGSVTVTDRSGRTVRVTENRNGTYTFTQPAGRVTIDVTFVRTGESTFFTDVPETFWAYDEIAWAYENGYVNGTSATTFNPNGAISRQQVWMILARLSGADPADMAAARAWAMENGVSDGTNPGNAVTRQQLVALLFRFAELRNYANDQRADLSVFPDAGTVAEYAVEPMQWSVANDIVGGTTAGTLNPEGTATRAQFAVILYRFWTNV